MFDRARWLLPATSIALLVLFAACGGGDNASNTAQPNATQQSNNGGGSSSTATANPGGGNPTTTPASNNNGGTNAVSACSVLTTAEVSAAVSETMVDGAETDDPPDYECEWDNADGTTAVYVTAYQGTSSGAQAEYGVLDPGSEAVSGLGDKAHWALDNVLEILKGSSVLEIQVVDFKTGADDETESKTLATPALERLP